MNVQIDLSLPFTLILLLVQIGLGIYILKKTALSESSVSFAGLCFSLSLWTWGAYLLGAAKTSAEVGIWGRFIFLGPPLIAYFFLLFSFVFPKGQIIKSIKILLLILPAIFMVIVPSTLILKNGFISSTGPIAIWGAAYPWFYAFFLSYFGWGILNFGRKYYIARGSERIQIRYVFFGLFLAFLFGIICNLALPAVGNSKYVTLGPFFTLAVVGFTAYAMAKHRLMDISIIISRAAAEVMAIALYSSIYFGFVYYYQANVSNLIDGNFLTITIIYGIIVGQTFRNVRLFFQTTADQVFLRGKYDYYETIANAASRVGQKLSLDNILKIIDQTLRQDVEISEVRVVLDVQGAKPIAELVIPCVVEGRLIAYLALGPKLSEEPYNEKDRQLLAALASQTALAIDHARSYEKIRAELRSVERRLAFLGSISTDISRKIGGPLTVIKNDVEKISERPGDLGDYQERVLRQIAIIEDAIFPA